MASAASTKELNVSIKRVPVAIVRKLKKKATSNHRSLQGELMAIITEAAERPRVFTVEELLERARRRGLPTRSEAVEIIRADRDSR